MPDCRAGAGIGVCGAVLSETRKVNEVKLFCTWFGDGWYLNYPSESVQCSNGNSFLMWVLLFVILWILGGVAHEYFVGGDERKTAQGTYALAKAEPAMDIEYIDELIEVRQGDTVVIQNSNYQREATAKEDTRIGVKRKWRGW